MNLVVFGASGKTGLHVVEQALNQGYQVTAAVRRPDALSFTHPNLKVVRGDLQDQKSIEAAVTGQDVVLSAIGAPLSRKPTTVHAQSAGSILTAMTALGVSRFIGVTSGGTNPERDPHLDFRFLIFRQIFINIYRDQMNMEALVQKSQSDWTIVRPAQLTDEGMRGNYRVASGYTLPHGRVIGRADLAHFMVSQVNDRRYVRDGVAIAY